MPQISGNRFGFSVCRIGQSEQRRPEWIRWWHIHVGRKGVMTFRCTGMSRSRKRIWTCDDGGGGEAIAGKEEGGEGGRLLPGNDDHR
jgi:hypothetical protein